MFLHVATFLHSNPLYENNRTCAFYRWTLELLLGSGFPENTAVIIHVHVFGRDEVVGSRLSLSLALVDNTMQLTKVVVLVYGRTRNESLRSLTSLPVLGILSL